jgi:hypothetical protein
VGGRRLIGSLERHLRVLSHYDAGQLRARAATIGRRRLHRRVRGRHVEIDARLVPTVAEVAHAAVARSCAATGASGGRLELLGRSEPLVPTIWVPSPGRPRLWGFTLEYHGWLVALAAAGDGTTAWAYLDRWLEQHGRPDPWCDAWHPYVISSRVPNWLALLSLSPPQTTAAAMVRSLGDQVGLLEARLERDVAGNHLLRNRSALAVAAMLGSRPATVATALRSFHETLAEQVDADGFHGERSTGYHALAIEDALDVLSACDARLQASGLRALVAAMLGVLAAVSPPDAPRPHLNDSSPGQGADTAGLLARAAALGIEPALRAQRGLARYATWHEDGTHVVFDVAQPSRHNLPYHVHADSLAMTVSHGETPIIVDRGVATYEPGPDRAWWRSTAAHSTVEVDGTDSSELVGAFRAARLARTTIVRDDGRTISARHDGGGRRDLAHLRTVTAVGPGSWEIRDTVPSGRPAVARWHLPPGAVVTIDGNTVRVSVDDVDASLELTGFESVDVRESRHALSHGRESLAPTIEARLGRGEARTSIRL